MSRFGFMQSISQRITLILALVTLLGAVVTTLVISRVVDHEMNEVLDQGLRESADLMHNIMMRAPSASLIADAAGPRNSYEEHLVWQVIDRETRTVVSRSSLAPTEPMHTQLEADLFDLSRAASAGPWRVITLPFGTGTTTNAEAAEQGRSLLLLVAQSYDERMEAQAEAAQFAALAGLSGAVLTTLLMYLLIRLELRRIQQLSQAVASHEPMRPGARLPTVDRQELESIVEAVEGLGQRLAKRVISERAFTAHAAHALRTPLAGMDVQLTMAARQAPDDATRIRLEQALAATRRLSRVVQALLAMFRTGLDPKPTRTDLSKLLQSLSFPGLDVVVSGPPVEIDADLLAAVMMNLLDNAQRHGASRVEITSFALPDSFEITVADNGGGCFAEKITYIQAALDRQDYKSGSALTGLGLILADLVLRAHGGRVHLLLPHERHGGNAAASGFSLRMAWPKDLH